MERWRTDLNRRIETRDVVLPEWFPQIQFGSWECSAGQRPPRSRRPTPAADGTMDALERLVAIQEIRDQIARYAIWFDDKEWDEFATLWADEAVFEANGLGASRASRPCSTSSSACLPAGYQRQAHEREPLVEPDASGETRPAPAPTSSGSRRTSRTGSSPATTTSSCCATAAGCSPHGASSSCRSPRAARRCPRPRSRSAARPCAPDRAPTTRPRAETTDMTELAIADRPRRDPDADRQRLPVQRGPGLGCRRESALLFHDIPGDARWRWTRAGGMQVDLTPTFKGNGMALDNDGHLLVCEQVSSVPRPLPRRQARARRPPLPAGST